MQEKCWPNLTIDDLTVIAPVTVRHLYLYDPTGTRSECRKPVGHISTIQADGSRVVRVNDYQLHESTDVATGTKEHLDLPSSNVLQFFTEDGNKITVRPSGTEPKIKFYFGVKGELQQSADFDKVNAALDQKIEDIKHSMQLV